MTYISFAWTGWDHSIFWTYFLQSTFIVPAFTISVFLGVFFYKTVYHYNFTYSQPKFPVTSTTMITMQSMLTVCDGWKCILAVFGYIYNESSDFLFGVLNAATLLSVIISICISNYVNNEENCWSLTYEPIFKLSMVFDFFALIFIIPASNPRLLLLLASILSTVCRIISFIQEIRTYKNFKEEGDILVITLVLLKVGLLAVIITKTMSLWTLANIRLMYITETLCYEYKDHKKLKQLKNVSDLPCELKNYFLSSLYNSSDFIAQKHLDLVVTFLANELSSRPITTENETEQTAEEYLANLRTVTAMKRDNLQQLLKSSWYTQSMEFLTRKIR